MNTPNTRQNNLSNLVMCSFFASLTAVFAQILIPMVPVPISLATLAVMLAGGILGPKWGAISMTIYTLLGAFGLPVYAQMMAGLAILVGPTGGYIFGYILAAFVVGLLVEHTPSQPAKGFGGNIWLYLPYLASLPACYIPGTIWFMYVTGSDLWFALLNCVFPFLVGDLLKVLCAAEVVTRVRSYLRNATAN